MVCLLEADDSEKASALVDLLTVELHPELWIFLKVLIMSRGPCGSSLSIQLFVRVGGECLFISGQLQAAASLSVLEWSSLGYWLSVTIFSRLGVPLQCMAIW
jgi:hypothetical protein